MKKLPVLNNALQEITFASIKDMMCPIYLDNNSTTITDNEAVIAMMRAAELDYANPSGIHEAGKIARKAVEDARTHVCKFIGCGPDEVIFTSGGTESINTAINSAIQTQKGRNKIISCQTEHGAVLNKLESLKTNGYEIHLLSVDRNGIFDIDELKSVLDDKVALVSLMAANNETGTRHKALDLAVSLTHYYGALFHMDAVQIAGKLPLKPFIDYGVDFLSISAHKMYGPKGIGALYVRRGTSFVPLIFGGTHESDKRAGTENVPGIMAFGVVSAKMFCSAEQIKPLHDRFIELLKIGIPSIIINGGDMSGTINVGFLLIHRESMVVKLSANGVYASVGSACAKGIAPSHVLVAMKVPQEYIHGSVRFSLSKYTTIEEIERAAGIIVKTYNELRAMSLGIVV